MMTYHVNYHLAACVKTVALATAAACLFPSGALAQPDGQAVSAAAAPADAIPDDFAEDAMSDDQGMKLSDDAGFASMVDFQLLAAALENGDALMLTDFALQWAEAERILMRKHESVTSEALLQQAGVIATSSGDSKALARVSQVAAARGLDDLAKQLETAAQLGAGSRSLGSSGDAAPSDEYVGAEFDALFQSIRAAEAIGDKNGLLGLKVDVSISALPEELQAWLDARIDKASERVGQQSPEQEALLKLLGEESRAVGLKNTPFDPGTWRVSPPRESESQLGGPSGLVHPGSQPQQRPTFQSNMQRRGYNVYRDVKIQNNGAVTQNGRIVGHARQTQTTNGNAAWVFKTQNGGTVVRRQNDSVNSTYIRRGYGR